MKFMLTISAALLVLSSCTKNELIEESNNFQNDGKIRFAATANKSSVRAGDKNPVTGVSDLQNNVKEFFIKGYVTGETTTLVNTKVEWNGQSWEYANEPYWPSHNVDFYAYANCGTITPNIDQTGITATAVTVAEDMLNANGQKDLLLALNKEQSKTTRTPINFKHAMTQIVFSTGNIDPSRLVVRIGGLRIVNVAETGSVSYLKADEAIKWGNLSAQTSNYHIQGLQTDATTFDAADTKATNAYTVTDQTTAKPANYPQLRLGAETNSLLLIPQDFTAWKPTAGAANTQAGSYIEILAIINAVGSTSTDTKIGDAKFYYSGQPVQGLNGTNDKYGKIYIPIESVAGQLGQWVASKRINYIITFGDKNSGSGGGGFDENGNPVLVPIKFSATVEDWTNVDIPLLTASFEANSSNISNDFINNYTTLLLNDISGAPEAKIYKASITITGELKTAATPTFAPTAAHKMAKGSTVTYNFSGITAWNAQTIAMTVPTGWAAKSYKTDLNTEKDSASTGTITLDGTNDDIIVFTKE